MILTNDSWHGVSDMIILLTFLVALKEITRIEFVLFLQTRLKKNVSVESRQFFFVRTVSEPNPTHLQWGFQSLSVPLQFQCFGSQNLLSAPLCNTVRNLQQYWLCHDRHSLNFCLRQHFTASRVCWCAVPQGRSTELKNSPQYFTPHHTKPQMRCPGQWEISTYSICTDKSRKFAARGSLSLASISKFWLIEFTQLCRSSSYTVSIFNQVKNGCS